MATKRQGTARRSSGRNKAGSRGRRTTKQRRRAERGTPSGARQAKRQEAARELQHGGPRLVAISPAASDETARAVDRTAEAEATLGAVGAPEAEEPDAEAYFDRTMEAASELSRHREEREAAFRTRAREGTTSEFPTLADIAIELALGALRLARTIATAPLRLALAFLRPREA